MDTKSAHWLVENLKYPALLCDRSTKTIVYKNSIFNSTFGFNVEKLPEWEQWVRDICEGPQDYELTQHIGEQPHTQDKTPLSRPRLLSFDTDYINIGAFSIIIFKSRKDRDCKNKKIGQLNEKDSLLYLSEDTPSAIYTMLLQVGNETPRYTFLSNTLLNMLNLDRTALLENPEYGFSIIHPDDQERWRMLAAECFRKKSQFVGEVRVIVKREVKLIRAEANPKFLSDGSILWYGYVQDITQSFHNQRQLHETLLAAKAFYWKHELTKGIITIDYVKRNGKQLETKNQTLSFLEWISRIRPDYKERVLTQIKKMHNKNNDKYVLTYPVKSKDNVSYQWVRVHGGPISYSHSGVLLATGGVGFNITEEIEKEQLQQKIESNLREQLQQSFIHEAISHSSSAVAHDLGNALSVIRWSIEACQDTKANPMDKEDLYQTAYQALDFAEELRSNLNRPNRHNFTASNLNYFSAIEKFKSLSYPFIDTDLSITINIQENHPENISGVETEFLQVFYNLLVNAVESKLAGKHLNVILDFGTTCDQWTTDPPLIGNVPEQALRYVKIKVSDTGSGIPGSEIGKIFSQRYSTKSNLGRGFGLAIISRIIRANGGAIWCDSQLGHGTTFTIAWPVEPKHMKQSSEEVSWTKNKNICDFDFLNETKILVVDDNEDVALGLASMLKDVGANVTVVTDPKVALTKLQDQRRKWSALITDQDMPTIKGLALARAASSINVPIPAIIVTANPYDIDLLDCEYKVLKKPVNIMDIVSALSLNMLSNS